MPGGQDAAQSLLVRHRRSVRGNFGPRFGSDSSAKDHNSFETTQGFDSFSRHQANK